ncbi:hypothetical protein LTR93_000415 [Exophiala xenobiotica]|nr:hypothetical protein LTR93_000415 [Exophiala xenobiotica]
MEKTKNTRTRAPCEEYWDEIRPDLEQHYVEERLPLKKVAKILEEKYKFRATISAYLGRTCMYKMRLDKWGLRKNFKMTQLAAAADVVEPFYRVGLNPPKLLVDNRELPVKLVRRHFADRLQESKPLLESRNHRHTLKGLNLRAGPSKTHVQKIAPQVPRVTLQLSLEMGPFEKTLIQVNHYFTWRSSREDDYFLMQDQHTTQSSAMTDPAKLYNLIVDLESAMIDEAFHLVPNLFREALVIAPRVISEQHPQLLSTLLTICPRRSTNHVEHMMSAIFSRLTSMARKLLSEHHAILMVLQLRLQRFEMDIPFLSLLRLIHDIALRQHDHFRESLYELELDMVYVISYEEGPAAASRFCEDSLLRCKEMLGPDHWWCRRLRLELALMLFTDGLNTAAERMCQELLAAPFSPQSDNFREQELTRLMTINLLGDIVKDWGDYEGAASWYRQAYDGFKECWGPEDQDALLALHNARQMEREVATFNQSAIDGSETDTEESGTTDEQVLEQLIRELGEDITRLDIDDAANTTALVKEPWEPSSLAFADPEASRCAGAAGFIPPLDIPKTNDDVGFDEQGLVRNNCNGSEAFSWPSSSRHVVQTPDIDPQTVVDNDTSASFVDGASYPPFFFEQYTSNMQATVISDNHPNTMFESGSILPSFSEHYMPTTPPIPMADNAQQALNNTIDALPPLNTEVDLEILDYTPLVNVQSDFDPRIHEFDMDFNMDDFMNWDGDLGFQELLQLQEGDTYMLDGL